MSDFSKLLALSRLQGSLFDTSVNVLLECDESLKELSPQLLIALKQFLDIRGQVIKVITAEILSVGTKAAARETTYLTDCGEALQEQLSNLTFGKM